eukprot:GHVL01024873.1.p1 GENE.GHVL01024873.1~~GHVL01024873.1.p1  ORF type:complete len:158 (+),score=25.38 GHVL01024873.1:125-598(+)
MNGCSKSKTSRVLRPYIQLQQNEPQVWYHNGVKMISNIIKKSSAEASVLHPCIQTLTVFKSCLRRKGGRVKKCRNEGLEHKQCIIEHKHWRFEGKQDQEISLLEELRVFSNSDFYHFREIPLNVIGQGTVLSFTNPQENTEKSFPKFQKTSKFQKNK